MSTTTRTLEAHPDHVWDILSDGWMYPLWVVGASRMREVDDAWPAVGSRLHHSVGAWPLMIDDTTSVLECSPRSRLVLQARAWPIGAARVTLELEARGARTEVVMHEQAVSGPGALVPDVLQDPPLRWRNVEALRRLALVAENRP